MFNTPRIIGTLFIGAMLSAQIFFHIPCAYAEYLDGIVAVVEDDVILDSELRIEVANVTYKLKSSGMAMPPAYILRKQVLERLIIDKLQRQLAERSGIKLTDEMLNNAVLDIARRNNMGLEEFKSELRRQHIDYQKFVENIHNEIIINQLRAREIGERIKVTDKEVEHYLETQGTSGETNAQYRLGHILVSVPSGAAPAKIQKAKQKADLIVAELHKGLDFEQAAISNSDDNQALKGGDLGWRNIGQIPTLFTDIVKTMAKGDIAGPLRSPSGFHIIKLLDVKGKAGSGGEHTVTQTHVRHILIKTNELVDDNEAQKRLHNLRERILQGDDFAELARAHSDDKVSALKGGDLGWVAPGSLVPPFEEAMEQLALKELSEPVQTQFGWHLIQVLGRQNRSDSGEFKKNQAIEEIRKRKIEEETELWLRRLRDEAYVEIRANAL
ncbi:MAG: peptidylprolyl isomerase [Gammaproteobacteria bacterium]